MDYKYKYIKYKNKYLQLKYSGGKNIIIIREDTKHKEIMIDKKSKVIVKY